MKVNGKGMAMAGALGALLLLQACGRDEVLENQNLDTEFSEQNQQNQQNPQNQPDPFENEGAVNVEPGAPEESAPSETNDPGV